MGAQLRFGTAGATGGGWSAQPGTVQPAMLDYRAEPRWSYQQRSPKTWKDRNRWDSLWSFGCRVGGGDLEGYGPSGMTLADVFEPYSCDGEGTQTLKWIKGQCVDASGNASAGAIVQAFRTSDDAFAGEVNANSTDGTFDVPTPYVGANHYLVAYKPGSPDIGGTTVNTLQPTNIDGT
jgi:hypothetical protein